jgi:hypothetical protein
MLSLAGDYGNEVAENFAHVICQAETVLRKCCQKIFSGHWDFRGLAISQEAILSDLSGRIATKQSELCSWAADHRPKIAKARRKNTEQRTRDGEPKGNAPA